MPCKKCPPSNDTLIDTSSCSCSSAISAIGADIATIVTLPEQQTIRAVRQDIKFATDVVDGLINFFSTNTSFSKARTDTANAFNTLTSTIEDVTSEIISGVETIARQNEPLLIAIVVAIILVVILAVLIGLPVLFAVAVPIPL